MCGIGSGRRECSPLSGRRVEPNVNRAKTVADESRRESHRPEGDRSTCETSAVSRTAGNCGRLQVRSARIIGRVFSLQRPRRRID